MPAIRDALLDAWAVLLPVSCAGCGGPDRALCAACRDRLAPALAWHALADGTAVVSALDYSGVVRNVILGFKEQGRTDAARALATPLRWAVAAAYSAAAPAGAGGSRLELVTVPSSRTSLRRRGYDPLGLLLRRAGLSGSSRLLAHSRGTREQKGLDRGSRERNLIGSLRARRPLAGRRFILIDDIMTTGSTMAEAVRAIREAGGEVEAAATLAHTAKLFATRGRS